MKNLLLTLLLIVGVFSVKGQCISDIIESGTSTSIPASTDCIFTLTLEFTIEDPLSLVTLEIETN